MYPEVVGCGILCISNRLNLLTVAFNSSINFLILFFLIILSSTERTVLKSLSKFVDFYGFAFTSVWFLYIFWGHFIRWNTLRIILSCWWTFPLIIIKSLSSFLVVCLVLESTLSDMNIGTGVFWGLMFAWDLYFHSFTLNLTVSLQIKQAASSIYVSSM